MTTKSPTVIEAAKSEAARLVAEAEAAVKSVPEMLASLEKNSVTPPYLMRALGLPFDSVDKWKRGDISSEELALLRIVYAFPWMVLVADHGFDKSVANASVIAAAGPAMLEKAVVAWEERAAAVEKSAEKTETPKDWVDGLKPYDKLHEKEKGIEYTVTFIPGESGERFGLVHGGGIHIKVYPEFIREWCTFGPIQPA